MNDKQIKDIINWDIETWKKILPYLEQKLINFDKASVKCIEIGAREGGISLWMAMNGFNITCSDIYYDLEEAKKLHLAYNVQEKVSYKKINVLEWDEKNQYDVIIIKSVLGSLQNENSITTAVNNIYANLKKGGIVLFAENSKATIFHQLFRKKFTDWGKIWFYFDEKTTKNIFKNFSEIEIKYNGVLGVFGGRIKMSKIFSTIDNYLLNHIVPNKLKYMLFGSAKK